MSQIVQNLQHLHETIQNTAAEHDRDGGDINLVAVSKKQPDEKIQAALDAGHRIFGENRVQEAQGHWAPRREQYPDLELHLIGPLQTNKAKDAVALFDVIQTLDREKLAQKLSNEMASQGRDLPCFIQVNTGEEDQKSGILPAQLGEFYDFCYTECGLDIQGLMCIPPIEEPATPHFALLRQMAQDLGLKKLSMGMSADFEKAIPLGATHVRIGTAVFGERKT